MLPPPFLKTGIYITQSLIHRECLFGSKRLCVCHAQFNTGTLGIHEFDILSFSPEMSGLKAGGLPVIILEPGFESLTAVVSGQEPAQPGIAARSPDTKGLLSSGRSSVSRTER